VGATQQEQWDMQLTRDYLRLKESIGIGSLGVAPSRQA
jgi:hypothetical protein